MAAQLVELLGMLSIRIVAYLRWNVMDMEVCVQQLHVSSMLFLAVGRQLVPLAY